MLTAVTSNPLCVCGGGGGGVCACACICVCACCICTTVQYEWGRGGVWDCRNGVKINSCEFCYSWLTQGCLKTTQMICIYKPEMSTGSSKLVAIVDLPFVNSHRLHSATFIKKKQWWRTLTPTCTVKTHTFTPTKSEQRIAILNESQRTSYQHSQITAISWREEGPSRSRPD